jgi:serine/threonine-protein kinase RsbW
VWGRVTRIVTDIQDEGGPTPVAVQGPSTAPEQARCVCRPERDDASDQWVHERATAEPAAVRVLRRRVRSWLRALECDEDLAESVVLIVDEAVTNAVEHACPDWECHVELVAGPRGCGNGFAVLVSDNGAWQEASDPGYRGRGLKLIRQLSERSSIESSERGTEVRMCWAFPSSSRAGDGA